MRDKIQDLKEQGAKEGLSINATKTKLMRIRAKRVDGVSIEREQIEMVNEFTFLGSIVSRNGGSHSRC